MTDDRITQIANEHFMDCNQLTRHQFINFARAVIEAECRGPDGYVLVPAEPTPSQLDVAVSFALNVKLCGDYNWSAYMRDVYARMLAAAPKPAEPDCECGAVATEHCPACSPADPSEYAKAFQDMMTHGCSFMKDGMRIPPEDVIEPVAQEPVKITDGMAYAFHNAIGDGSLGESEVEEIKTGLRAAFANIQPQPDQSAEAQREINMALDLDDARERIAELERQRNRLVTALQAETGKLVACEKQRDDLVEMLEEAREEVVGWAAYASEYFQQKHNLKGYVEKLDAALASVKGQR